MSYLLCVQDCGKEPGLDSPFAGSTINWLGESTPDQKRIEDVLDRMNWRGSSVLHVGIGNSELGRRFLRKTETLEGVTIGKDEYDAGMNQRWYDAIHIVNKYSRDFLRAIDGHWLGFIIDNNLASYACCVTHFHAMMDTYRSVLKPGGMILTDRAGLAHAPGDPNWNLSDDIQGLADRFGLTLTAETEMVLALRK